MVDWLYNHMHRYLFKQKHPTKGGELYVKRSEQRLGSVVQEGTGSTNKPVKTFSHKVSHFGICQDVENVSHTYPGR